MRIMSEGTDEAKAELRRERAVWKRRNVEFADLVGPFAFEYRYR
jgi:hypothetical protein